jgi:hypothetical protein
MRVLHDPVVRSDIEQRLKKLQPTATPQWGRMSVNQMLWHVNEGMLVGMGDRPLTKKFVPVPRAFIKHAVLNWPWMKGAPTNPTLVARGPYDFNEERARCLALLQSFVLRPMTATWPEHPAFGRMTGEEQSRLQAKHLDHHLRQFGV